MNDDILVNELLAHTMAKELGDPITRNLVMLAIAEARMRVSRRVGESEAEWRARLPRTPFDMEFFRQVLASAFGKRDIIEALLAGKDLAQASGWDV